MAAPVTAVVPKFTVPLEAPNPRPSIVTSFPALPMVGPTLPIVGVVSFAVYCQTAVAPAARLKDVMFPPLDEI
ncbi:hypothetical protein D3C73_1553640 [compost metagenome]